MHLVCALLLFLSLIISQKTQLGADLPLLPRSGLGLNSHKGHPARSRCGFLWGSDFGRPDGDQDSPLGAAGSPGPFGPENAGRVRKEYPRAGPQKSRKSAPRSPNRVRKESKTWLLDSFRTLLGLQGALFRDFWGPARRTLFGLFRDSRAQRARETLCGAGPIAKIHIQTPLHQERPSLKTLTSLNKEVRPFFLGDNSIWSFPSVSSLSDYSIWRSWKLFSLAIIAFGAFGFSVPKYYYRLGNMDRRSLDSLI